MSPPLQDLRLTEVKPARPLLSVQRAARAKCVTELGRGRGRSGIPAGAHPEPALCLGSIHWPGAHLQPGRSTWSCCRRFSSSSWNGSCWNPTPSLRGRLARLGNPRKPILKPNKPLILADHVGERRREKGEATCITEMSMMMACWKQNEFRDEACKKEIRDFFDCASRAEAARKMRSIQEDLGQLGSLPPRKLNKLLQRFPNKPHVS